MNEFIFNRDVERRDDLLGIRGEWAALKNSHSVRDFDYIDVHILKELIENKYIDPLDTQNESPSVEEMFLFMNKYPIIRAKGYAVSPFRKDYRVSIDTLFVPKRFVSRRFKQEFLSFCASADELTAKPRLHAWWD
ncbi:MULTISPECIES: hypothetical protein [unclassified Paenibacillus]|uniref:hypothetical protein n=1 Tax=unclassified Paenibacillus TaxID=185978 RepID=UPI00240595CB|nr:MULTISPECIES: hypothetical protein [unclassified Paenibacillus]MDF9839845.1 hypothetical protein [Paenibacillus sp. PastF-2]MDF9846426.1 hypothetical protein [Paenibacillus sp. PastM-2]MDF9853225.1 hypothetical protein [Paenibacillus sp. PastF-1]MDH6478271.1 hypothetical protein [Paenibacillus sp. PastH-2]MDH6506230.1 hypothetical protein [Paenibacillus sp. PastM-3]